MAEIATIHQLHPVKVLVAGDDPLFVARAADELAALGFNVMSTTTPGRTAEHAALQRVNVVLLEVSGGLASAVSTASALDALPHRVQVVLFGPRGRASMKLGYELLDPLATGEELAAVVQSAYRGGASRAGRLGRS